nr:unnamed protein product [Digitaria exilis]
MMSTATSAVRAPPGRDADVESAAHGRLERRLVVLERDWHAYKTGRPPDARRHRRSRSATTGTPSSAVTSSSLFSAAPRPRSSSRRCSSPAAAPMETSPPTSPPGPPPYPTEKKAPPASAPCKAGTPWRGYSTSSSCTGAAVPTFSSSAGGDMGGELARKSDEGRSVARKGRAAWISAAIAVVVMGFVAMIILEFHANDDRAEYLVPT